MTTQQQQIAIAEWMGYVWYRAPQDRHFPEKKYRFLAHPSIQEYEGQVDIWKQRADGTEKIIDSGPWKAAQGVDYVPDFPNDLKAMHEAEQKLRENQFHFVSYPEILFEVISGTKLSNGLGYFTFNFIHATAAERAEALLKTIGKWDLRVVKG